MNSPPKGAGGFTAQTLRFGSQPLVVLEGDVLEAERWRESSVHSRYHLGGGQSIGTTIVHKGTIWLKEDTGLEVSIQGNGELQLRPGHRLRVLARGERGDLRVVVAHNLTTGIEQWDEREATAARGTAWLGLVNIVLVLALVILLVLGLLLWALSKHSGAHYLLPALIPLAVLMAIEFHGRNRFRRFAEAAMR